VNNNIHIFVNEQDLIGGLSKKMKEILKIKDLEQVRLLSDPLKLQIIRAFAEAPKTTKAVAEELGHSVTRLYRHVDALHNAGLLEITSERQKRGTIERTFRAVAQRFEADHRLFAKDHGEDSTNTARDLLRVVEGEILDALREDGARDEPQAIMMRLRCKGSAQRMARLRESLNAWIEAACAEDEGANGGEDEQQEFGALIAFYPIREETP
jgi:predicted ArsR family transcriptional regulator